MQRVKTWVVGRGGLVGSAVARRPELEPFAAEAVPWGTEEAGGVLESELERFSSWVGDEPWGIVWAAGSGVMSTGADALAAELDVFRDFCGRVAASVPPGRGGIYLTSSAGGTFAGSQHPPFDDRTLPAPLNAYGRTKLAQELELQQLCADRVHITIGRLANVFGPGQDLTKQQGLVTQLSLCALLGRPATVFAPLATLRDYIYVDDAAGVVAADVVRMSGEVGEPVEHRVVCSGRSTSIAELIAMVERVTGRQIPLTHSLPGEPYILDLRLSPSRREAVDRLLTTPLETGVNLVWQDLVDRMAQGLLVDLA